MSVFKIKRFSKDYDLEDYEELDDKKISKMSDNQKLMLLDDERQKAKRNRSKIVNKHAKERGEEGAREGRESGEKSGKTAGRWIGGIAGGITGGGLASELHENYAHKLPSKLKGKGGKAVASAAGVLALGTAGSWLGGKAGKHIGGSIGEVDGRERGENKGRREGAWIAKELGHDEIDHTNKTARKFDEHARKHHKEDKWEIGFRNKLKSESKEKEEKARRARREEIERRKAAAEERRADADMMRANTDRARYWDDLWDDDRYYRRNRY